MEISKGQGDDTQAGLAGRNLAKDLESGKFVLKVKKGNDVKAEPGTLKYVEGAPAEPKKSA